jgi:hypothetical protein
MRANGAARLLLLRVVVGKGVTMSLVRLLGFKTLTCGCLAGHYRELATSREIAYIEEKGAACGVHGHRRNHTVMPERTVRAVSTLLAARAS